jgi:hypothetical protein
MKSKPPCETVLPWLKANLGPHCLAPLTGTDAKALAAAVQIIHLWNHCGEHCLIVAFEQVVICMQPKTRELAYHAIAHVADWHTRAEVWRQTALGAIEAHVCAFEPGGSR